MTPNDDNNKHCEKTRRAAERKAALRKQAEEQVRSMEPASQPAQTPEEIQRVLHELRVHQIELEMQNEELREAQEEIEAGRARYFDLYDLAPVGYCTLSEKGMILEANLTAAKLLGAARGALVKQPLSHFIVKDDQDSYYLHRKHLFETGEAQACELRLVKPDGSLFWAHLTETAAQAEDGSAVCRVALSDITESKRAAEELFELAERYRLANKATNDVIWDWDIVNDAQRWNETGTAVFGWTDIVEAPQTSAWWLDRVHPEDRQRVDDTFFAAIHDPAGDCWRDEYRFRKADGAYAYAVDRGHILRDADGRALRMIGAMLDITERKRAEEALLSYKQIVSSTSEGISLLDKNYCYVIVNEAYESVSGKKQEELIGVTVAEYLGEAVFYEQIKPHFDRSLNGETVQFQDWFDYPTLGRRFIEVTYFPYVDAKGDISGVVANTRDITERKQAEAALRESERLLKTAQRIGCLGGWEWNIANGQLTWSDELYRIWGVPKDYALTQDSIVSLIHPDDRERNAATIREILNSPADKHSEFRIVRPDGSIRHMQQIVEVSSDAAGKAVHAVGTIQDITERKRAEYALRSSRQLLDATEALSAIGGWEWDVATQVMTWTDGTHRIHDLDSVAVPAGSPEHIARSLACYDPGDRPRIEEAFRRCVETGEPYDLECGFTTAKGRRLCVRTMGRAIRENGRVVKVLGNLQDITEQKRIEEESARSAALLRDVVDMVPSYICAKNSEGRFLLVNRKLADFYGISVDTMTGMLHADLCENEKELRAMLASDRQVIESGRAEVIPEETMKKPDGSIAFLETYKIPFTADGKLAVLIASVDITERKSAEEALQRVSFSIDNLSDCVFWIGETGCFTDVNATACRKLGYTREELLTMSVADIDPYFPSEGWAPHWEEIRQCGLKVIETVHLTKNGNRIPMELVIHNQLFGNTRYNLVLARDLTQRKRAEVENEKLQAQLQQAQKMEAVGRLAGGVAHDFNNMLGVILGYTELALERAGLDGPLLADLEEIRKAAQRSANLTRQLLAFARKQTIAPKVLDLNETVEGMLKMLRRLIGEDIALDWEPGQDLWPVKMDPTQIDQILANLCVNARDAIAGVGRISVETRNTALDEEYCTRHADFTPGEYVRLTVSDDGCGMDSKTLLILFDPFFTTKEMSRGTGLGLATVYGIVKQNNGFINVYSEPGQGTIFNIHLPRHAAKTEFLPKQAQVQATLHGQETILLVEDEPANLQMTTIMLERQGYTVLTASTPGEAIRLAGEQKGRIDLLLTDVIMPEMNGPDLARNLLTICPSLKHLFMSGYTADMISHHGVLDEGEHFIQKPFSLKDLGVKLREAMEG